MTSKPDSIAACDGSVDARRMVRALQRVGGALQDRLVDGRADAHERVGAQAVLADDHDVADRGAALRRGRLRGERLAAAAPGRRPATGVPAGGGGVCALAMAGGAGDGQRAGQQRAAALHRTADERIRRSCSFFNLP